MIRASPNGFDLHRHALRLAGVATRHPCIETTLILFSHCFHVFLLPRAFCLHTISDGVSTGFHSLLSDCFRLGILGCISDMVFRRSFQILVIIACIGRLHRMFHRYRKVLGMRGEAGYGRLGTDVAKACVRYAYLGNGYMSVRRNSNACDCRTRDARQNQVQLAMRTSTLSPIESSMYNALEGKIRNESWAMLHI
jgi:hypothetical protein